MECSQWVSTLPAAAAIVAAIEKALADFGLVIDYHPVDPQYLNGLIDATETQAAE